MQPQKLEGDHAPKKPRARMADLGPRAVANMRDWDSSDLSRIKIFRTSDNLGSTKVDFLAHLALST